MKSLRLSTKIKFDNGLDMRMMNRNRSPLFAGYFATSKTVARLADGQLLVLTQVGSDVNEVGLVLYGF